MESVADYEAVDGKLIITILYPVESEGMSYETLVMRVEQ